VIDVENEDADAAVVGLIANARHADIQKSLRLLRMAPRDQRERSDEAQRGCEQQATIHMGLSSARPED
jgi:hypothetical protein